jgi:hypothetical protein
MSRISQTATAVVRKGVKTVTRPLKKLKHTLSVCTKSSTAGDDEDPVSVTKPGRTLSIRTKSSTTGDADDPVSVTNPGCNVSNTDDDLLATSINGDLPIIDISSNEDEVDQFDPQKELGRFIFLFLSLSMANSAHR